MTEENREDSKKDKKDKNDKNKALEARNLAAEADREAAEEMIPEIQQKISETKASMPKRGKAGKILIFLLAVFIVISVVRIVQLQMEDNGEEAEEILLTNVQVQQVTAGDISASSSVTGRLSSSDSVNVIPLVSGEVKELFVEEGDYVTEGQTLFTIDSQQAQIQMDQAQLGIKSAQDSVDALKKSLDRMQSLYDAGAVSLTDLESIQTQYDSALNALDQAKLSADAASSTLGYYTVTAPASGCATTVSVVAGGPAAQTSPAVVISDTKSLELKANVSEYLINNIAEGQKVDVYIRSLSEEPYTGTVTDIADTPAQGTYTYDVTIALSDYQDMKAGMLAEVSVVTDSKAGVVVVPSDAVITKRGETYVALITDGDKIELRKVTVGIDNGTSAEITSALRVGETLVVKGQNYVSDGEQVNIVE